MVDFLDGQWLLSDFKLQLAQLNRQAFDVRLSLIHREGEPIALSLHLTCLSLQVFFRLTIGLKSTLLCVQGLLG